MIFTTHTYKYKNQQNNNQQTTTNLNKALNKNNYQKPKNKQIQTRGNPIQHKKKKDQPKKGSRHRILSAKQKPAFLQPILKTMVQK